MNDGRLTIRINEREALPVRAIPYVAGWDRFHPDAVAAFLAQPDSCWMPMTLTAHWLTATTAVPIKPREWDAVVAQIKGFEAELRRQHGDDETGDAIGYAAWWRESLMHLPAGVYVWLDEFEREYLADRNSPLFFERLPSDGELILTPMIDANTMAMVMEGFQSDTVTAPEGQAAPTRTTSDEDWMVQARVIADECFDRDTSAKPTVRDSLATKNSVGQITGGYCFRVMAIMQERGIKGPRGIITNPGTVMREALQGKKWWANKPK